MSQILSSKYGRRAEERSVPNVPDNLGCGACNIAVPKTICKETVTDVDSETLENLAKSGITNLTKEYRLSCPKCDSQVFGILLEDEG